MAAEITICANNPRLILLNHGIIMDRINDLYSFHSHLHMINILELMSILNYVSIFIFVNNLSNQVGIWQPHKFDTVTKTIISKMVFA